ncbi:MAG: hypothetical protein IPM20_06785 [Gammaproteobacteria bacterium]|nr:hypothetical protein [Gammaproteobacteria bacterium]
MSNSLDIYNSKTGDLVLGDKKVYPEEVHSLEKAIKAIQETISNTPEFEGIIEELAEYTTDRPDREVIGVEAKLVGGGREDLIENAVYYKNKFERKIARNQLSKVEQYVYAHVLAVIETSFNQYVRPLILNNSGKEIVDAAVHRHICEPVYKAIVGFNVSINMQHVSGMLYFLTGKCHLLWSK